MTPVMINKRIVGYTIYLIMICAVGCQAGRSAQNAGPRPEALATYESTSSFYLFAAAQFKLKEGDVNAAIRLLGQAVKLDTSSAYLKLELVNLLLIKKEDQHALKLVEQVLSQDPDNIQALTLAGGIYQKQNKPDQAVRAYEKAIAQNPTEQNIYLLLGRIYWNCNDLENAERVFRQMTRIIPDSYAAFYFFGKVLSAEGKLEAAESALLRSLELESSLEEPRAELLKIYQTQNKPAKIAKTYQSMLALDPDNHRAALGLAEHYRQMNKPALSLKLLKDLGRRVDRDGSIISAIFEMFVETKQYEEALWALEGVLQSAPSNSDLHYIAGITLDGMERDDEALKHLAQVQPGSKFYNNAVIHSALLYHDMGKMNRAIGVVQAALAHDPDNADYYLYLGSFYEELERYDEALKIFQEGLRRDDKNARLHFHIGVVYDKMGSRQDSISAIKAVLKLTPNDAEALNYLGYTYADMGINLDEAETLIQTALRLKPDDGYITDSLGWVYFKRGQYTRALKWLNKAVQLVPDDPTILEHIGDVYLQMDSREKALTFYQRSLKKKEKDRQALKEKIRNLQSHEK
jgi:tetratricopeptide (TPR) repeat protein